MRKSFALISILLLFAAPLLVFAQEVKPRYPLPQNWQCSGKLSPPGPLEGMFPDSYGYLIPPGCTCPGAPSCGLLEMVQLAVNISQLILGLVGSAALLMFIYGGFLWLASAGSAEQVKKGKEVFLNALKGIALIFASWLIINGVVAALTGQTPGDGVLLFRGANQNDQGAPLQVPR